MVSCNQLGDSTAHEVSAAQELLFPTIINDADQDDAGPVNYFRLGYDLIGRAGIDNVPVAVISLANTLVRVRRALPLPRFPCL